MLSSTAPPGGDAPENLYQLRHQRWMMGRLLTTSYPAFEDFPATQHHLQRYGRDLWIFSRGAKLV